VELVVVTVVVAVLDEVEVVSSLSLQATAETAAPASNIPKKIRAVVFIDEISKLE